MKMIDVLHDKKTELEKIALRHGAYNVRVFGSVVRREESEVSDIDIIVDAGEKRSPWFPGGLKADLEELLGKKVDVVTTKGLRNDLREIILAEAEPL